MIAFSAFVSKVKDIVFPDLEPENLAFPHRNYIINALIIAQTHIQCLRTSNVNFYTKENAIDSCNVSAITVPPHAVIQAVYAFKPCKGCTRHFFRATSTNEIVCYANNHAKCACTTEADICNEANYGDQFCNLYYGGETAEPDSEFLCSDMMFAKGANDQLYLAPRFPCGYQVGFHWSGVKRTYEDTDAIVDDQDVIDLASLYLEGERALRIDRDFPKYERIMGNGRDARGGGAFWFRFTDTDYRCREEVRVSRVVTCHSLDDTSAFEHFLPTPLPERPPCVVCPTLILTIGPSPGSAVLTPVIVTLSTNNAATIYYTVDGSSPTSSSLKYTAPFSVASVSTTIKAIAYDASGCVSNTVTATYLDGCNAPAVTFDPVSGSKIVQYIGFNYGTVDISTIGNAVIRYTTDGSEPTVASPIYDATQGLIRVFLTTVLKARAFVSDTCFGAIGTATYLKQCDDPTVVFVPASGSIIASPSNVSIQTSGFLTSAIIYYTLDGTTPTTSSPSASPFATVSVTPGVTTVKAFVWSNETCSSPIATATYITACNSPTVTINPVTGSGVLFPVDVTLTAISGTVIRYTVGASPADPTAASTLYTVPVAVTSGQTIKGRAFNSGDATCFGAVASATYVEQCDNPAITFWPANNTAVQLPTYLRMSAPTGTSIRYTLDGTIPTAASTLYGAAGDGGVSGSPILISSYSTLVRAIAIRSGTCSGAVYDWQASTGSAFEFKYMCDTPDKVGVFHEFAPNGETDYHWMLGWVNTSPREIVAIEIYETASTGIWNTGQAWATRNPINPVEGPANFSVYPIAIFENQVQKFSAYQTTLGTFVAGAHVLEMYGDIRTPLTGFFKVVVFYGDGTRTEQVIPHTCVAVSPEFDVGVTPTCPDGLANSYSISGYSNGFFQGPCGGGVSGDEVFSGVLTGESCSWSGAGIMHPDYVGSSNGVQNVQLTLTSRGWKFDFYGISSGNPVLQGSWYKSNWLTPVGTYYLLDKGCEGLGPDTLSIA